METPDGQLLQTGREVPQQVGVLSPEGGLTRTLEWASTGPPPALRADGPVAERPTQRLPFADDPMYVDYRWVAMLHPVELADGEDRHTGLRMDPLTVGEVSQVEHGGREAWEAVVSTTPFYEPRCGCCPLLRSREVDLHEFADHPDEMLPAYPDAYRMRLDVGTGVCVLTAATGGVTPGAGHDLWIEAVDEAMADELFARPRRRGLFRRQ